MFRPQLEWRTSLHAAIYCSPFEDFYRDSTADGIRRIPPRSLRIVLGDLGAEAGRNVRISRVTF